MRCAPQDLPGAGHVRCDEQAVARATGAALGRLVVLLCGTHAERLLLMRWPGVVVRSLRLRAQQVTSCCCTT